MNSAKPTTYLTLEDLKTMASLKRLDAASGASGARRDGLLEEAHTLEELVKVRSSNARSGERTP